MCSLCFLLGEDGKAIFGLGRYAGMRTPGEVLSLRWEGIDWDEGRIRIDSPKTGLRTCPLFPELRAILEAAMAANLHSHKVVNYHGGSQKNLRTRLIRIIENAGLKPWPKLFVNLRVYQQVTSIGDG